MGFVQKEEDKMTIEHIALYVRDLEAMRKFYELYFSAQANDGYHNPKTGLRTYFLTFAGGARVELMQKPGILPSAGSDPREGWTHLAFQMESCAEVDKLTERLQRDGFVVESGPRKTGDGYYESCVLDPEGNRIELVGK